MKRFTFNMETVLGYRRQLEDLARAAFQTALAQQREAEQQLETLRRSLLETCQLGAGDWAGGLPVQRDAYKRQVLELIRIQVEVCTAREKDTQEKREQLLEAKKETRVMERLREKAWAAYQSEAIRLEQQEMDDLFLMKPADAV